MIKNLASLISFWILISSCAPPGDEDDIAVNLNLVPKPVIVLTPGDSTPSYDAEVTYKVSNLPFFGGAIYLFGGSSCGESDVTDVSAEFRTYNGHIYLDIMLGAIGKFDFSVKAVDQDGHASKCTSFSYEVLAPPPITSVSLFGPSSGDESQITVNTLVQGKLKINGYLDSNCTIAVGSDFGHSSYTTAEIDNIPNGDHSIYFNTENLGGVKSNCSTVFVNYEKQELVAPSTITMNSTSPGDESSVSITISGGGVKSGRQVTVYSDNQCSSGAYVSGHTASSTSTTFSVSGPGVNETRNYYATVRNSIGEVSPCSTATASYTRNPLSAPSSLVINSANPGDSPRANITVSGGSVKNGKTIRVFSDSLCSSENLIKSYNANSTSETFELRDLAPGEVHQFYAKVRNPDGEESPCSTATASYTRNTLLPPGSLSLAPGYSSVDTKINIELVVGSFIAGNRIHVYTESSCTNQIDFDYTTSAPETIEVSGLSNVGVMYELYVKQRDVDGFESSCSTVNVNYTYNHISTSKLALDERDPTFVASGDFNNDGNVDIAVTSGYVIETFLGDGAGSFGNRIEIPEDDGITSAASIDSADINNDGYDDLIIGNWHTINFYESNGDGTFKSPIKMSNNYVTKVRLADINSDGNVDLIVLARDESFNYIVQTLNGDGSGSFATPVTYLSKVTNFEIRDISGDGHLDIVGVQFYDDKISTFINDGSGGFSNHTEISSGADPSGVNLIDYDKDGDLDAAVAGRDKKLTIFANDGSGNLSSSTEVVLNSNLAYVFDVEVLDFDNDGNDDVIISHDHSDDISVVYGNGDSTFQVPVVYEQEGDSHQILVSDLNNDGKEDFILTNSIPSQDGELLIVIQ